jgi:GDP-L-fucose synthase
MASASVFVMGLDSKTYDENTFAMQSHINLGFGSDIAIAELAEIIKVVIAYKGRIYFDKSNLDSSPQKLLNSTMLKKMGWSPVVNLRDRLERTYEFFMKREN